MNSGIKTLLCVFALLCLPGIGSLRADDSLLVLPTAEGKEYRPLQAQTKKGVVLFFISPYCPTSNTFMAEMNLIESAHREDFLFYFVHSDRDQKIADVVQHTELQNIKAPVLLDKEQKLARRQGAKTTPEAVVIAPDGKTLYQGRINDLYLTPTKRQRKATTSDLRDALQAIQGGQPVPSPHPAAVGCKISGVE